MSFNVSPIFPMFYDNRRVCQLVHEHDIESRYLRGNTAVVIKHREIR